MKAFIFFARVGFLLSLLVNSPAVYASFKQDHFNDRNHYVVIGAFAQKEHAVKFTANAVKYNLKAEYDMNPNRNLYYVFVLITPELTKAVDEALKIRKASPFVDTWVYHGAMGQPEISQTPTTESFENSKGRDINPVTKQEIVSIPSQPESTEKSIVEKDTTAVNGPPLPLADVPEFPVGEVKPVNLSVEEIPSKNFVFQIYRAVDSKYIDGDVDVIDVEKVRKMASYKGNTSVKVAGPQSKSGNVTFNCEIFGYRKTQKDFSFKTQSKEQVLMDEAKNIVIPFELIRLQRGDIAVMYNVFFFKDAAIMRPESRYEVAILLGMLKENPAYKIKLHGHTNGNAAGKIISVGESKNYFSLSDSKDGFGSAKKLSEERANCIRQFLVSNGIDETRMLVKAWGGKRPIHDKHAAMAHENVRVEVEILEN
jgi:outer membrane protein OmpA-like peptidoglycan-associated protein